MKKQAAYILALVLGVVAIATAQTPKVINFSARGFVSTGERCLIGGFIIGPNDPNTLIIRALGPTLSSYNIQHPLPDPVLTVYDQDGNLLVQQDSYLENNAADLQVLSANNMVPPHRNECAVVLPVTPGRYTGVVTQKGKATGVALVEGYKTNH